MESALKTGNVALLKYLTARANRLPKSFSSVMAPLDETRFFRLGPDGSTVGYGLSAEALAKLGTNLLGKGFPRINSEELDLVVMSRLASFQRLEGVRIVGQHFPAEASHASTLEATEDQAVHISKIDVLKFQDVIDRGMIDDVMLSHASHDYNEANFPGINVIRQSTALHPALSIVPFDSIPASLNPVMSRYLRENMGHEGLIIPDWYDMGAIRDFVRELDMKPDSNTFARGDYITVRSMILAVDAGVSFITGIPGRIALDAVSWGKFKTKSPEAFAKLDAKLSTAVQDTFERIKPANSNVRLDIDTFSFQEKLLFMIYNKKNYGEDYAKLMESDEIQSRNMAVFKVLMGRGTGNYDAWNRTGVMTLVQRQKIIESLSGKTFASPPNKVSEEEPWFNALMGDTVFRKYYDGIDWESGRMRQYFTRLKKAQLSSSSPDFASIETRDRS